MHAETLSEGAPALPGVAADAQRVALASRLTRSACAQVAATFVRQYFSVRHAFPGNLYRFYSKGSIVLWPAAADFAAPRPASAPVQALEQCTGPNAINTKVRLRCKRATTATTAAVAMPCDAAHAMRARARRRSTRWLWMRWSRTCAA